MDRISCLAYLLFQVNDKEIKNADIRLVNGDVSLTKLKKNSYFLLYIQEAEKTLKEQTLNNDNVCKFVEQFCMLTLIRNKVDPITDLTWVMSSTQ